MYLVQSVDQWTVVENSADQKSSMRVWVERMMRDKIMLRAYWGYLHGRKEVWRKFMTKSQSEEEEVGKIANRGESKG